MLLNLLTDSSCSGYKTPQIDQKHIISTVQEAMNELMVNRSHVILITGSRHLIIYNIGSNLHK